MEDLWSNNNAMKAGADMYVSPRGLLEPRLAAAARMALGAFFPLIDNGLLRFHEEAGPPTASDFKYL